MHELDHDGSESVTPIEELETEILQATPNWQPPVHGGSVHVDLHFID